MSVSDRSAPLPWPVRLVERFTQGLAWIGGLALVALLLTVVLDVLLRNFGSKPLPGALDLVTYWWMPATVLLPMAFAELRGEHIRADLLSERLSPVWRSRLDLIAALVALPVFVLLVYYMMLAGLDAARVGESSTGSRISLPVWPARFVATLAVFALLLQTAVTVYKISIGRRPAVSEAEAVIADLDSGVQR